MITYNVILLKRIETYDEALKVTQHLFPKYNDPDNIDSTAKYFCRDGREIKSKLITYDPNLDHVGNDYLIRNHDLCGYEFYKFDRSMKNEQKV